MNFPKPVPKVKPQKYSSFSRTPMPERKRTVHKKSERAGVMARISVEASPQPKTVAWRCPALLEMARGRRCLLNISAECLHRPDVTGATTVACHSNRAEHGKGGARKADDCYSVWGCATCHRQLDQGDAPADFKFALFMRAHYMQISEWMAIACDTSEPLRFRRAALRALEHLNATLTGATP